jgi:hypothetical protein
MIRNSPVMFRDAGEAKKMTESAISSGVATLCRDQIPRRGGTFL